ncbi:lamin tail domain-containing protein [Methanogenium sp. S4BF]|uniref:lamin tail domain-containing protein n=1 Tax=Methanogenium sp. S4BF TaxID=1789226 RepID=UPI00241698A8|nr:lamin tail domain-containing protein [Methanogenium sp. S4BF]WFN35573.1 lamin tail domain-containing protein [Methanogenium sp. S4BF]
MGKRSRLGKLGIFVLLVAGIFGALNYGDEILQFVPSVTAGPEEDGLVVGAFNVQVFGTTKAAREDVMDVLGQTIRSYDLIAIQEIRDSSGTALPALLEEVNCDGSRYAYVASDRLGRTVSKEQYAYFYNTDTVRLQGAPQTYPEPEGTDPFHREPFIVWFEGTQDPVSAVCAVIHTDPDEATEEIAALTDVVDWIYAAYPSEPDVIVMGDFNADGTYFDEESDTPLRASGYHWLTGNDMDTTTGDTVRTYDRMVITESLTDEYTGTAGVFRYDERFGVAPPLLTAVSDHYPVYAVFTTGDTGSPEAAAPAATTAGATPSTSPAVTIAPPDAVPGEGASGWAVMITGVSPADEWVTIQNTGTLSQNLTGWILTDDTGSNRYTFPLHHLEPGELVTVYTGTGEAAGGVLYWGRAQDVWNNDGDTAYLYGPGGVLVSSFPVDAAV